jgi:hypothetical protein
MKFETPAVCEQLTDDSSTQHLHEDLWGFDHIPYDGFILYIYVSFTIAIYKTQS